MSKVTIYDEVCNKVAGFQEMGEEFTRKLVISGKARSTHENYLRQMAKLSVYYGRTPLEIEIGELEEYPYFLIQRDTDSMSSFKHWYMGCGNCIPCPKRYAHQQNPYQHIAET